MRIRQVNLFRNSTPFAFTFRSSHLPRSKADSVVVEIEFDNGISGWGECAPRPYVTGETSESIIRLAGEVFPVSLVDADIASRADIERVLQNLEDVCLREERPCLSALGGVDIALLDALGKLQKKPLLELLGGAVRGSIPYSLSIPILPIEELDRIMEAAGQFRVTVIKILMGPDPEENLKRVAHIRSVFGPGADLRIEANGIWAVPEAIEIVQRLKSFRISAVEQPVGPRNLAGLRDIREKTGVPVILDESICRIEDARKAIEANACDIVNIKLSKCGGLLRSGRIAEFAALRGIPCQLGTHVGESPILSRAGECFALATPNIILFEGCSPLLFGSDIEKRAPSSGRSEGLGVSISTKEMEPVSSMKSAS